AAVVRDGAIAHRSCAGTNPTPSPDLQYRLDSITITPTAAVILGLRDDGRLDLDDLVTAPLLERRVRPARRGGRTRDRHLLVGCRHRPPPDPLGHDAHHLSRHRAVRPRVRGPPMGRLAARGAREDARAMAPAGQLWSTVDDMARFGRDPH